VSALGWKYLTASDKDQILRGIADGKSYGGPYHVEFHPADRCNIECFFCSTAAIRGTDELPIPRFEELLGELKAAGTRSIRLAGGGEPLFHRQIKPFLRAVVASGIPIENVTTNAVLLDEEIADLLLAARCDQITVSLNTGDAATYATMMQTPARNFDRVLKNVKGLVGRRRHAGSKTPIINLQFLVWQENFRQIPSMYALARELEVDTIQFNGLAFLEPRQMMTVEETDEMMALYEEVVRRDEYRRISVINSYEQDISARVTAMNDRISAERQRKPALMRLAATLLRRDFTLGEKIEHHRRMSQTRSLTKAIEGREEYCIIGWHSMVVRTNGNVAPCCILQGKELGNIYKQNVTDVWHGAGFQKLRSELSQIINRGDDWEPDSERDETVVPMCGQKANETCPIRSFYYRTDVPFLKEFGKAVAEIRKA